MANIQISKIAGILLTGALSAGVCSAQDNPEADTEQPIVYDRARYELIVERSPFGADPLVEQENRNAEVARLALEREYRLCFLLEDEAGEIRAGFQKVQAGPNDPKSVMLMVGESYGGMKLTEIDLKDSVATIEYQGTLVPFELTKEVVAAAPTARGRQNNNQTTTRRFGSGFQPTSGGTATQQRQQPQQPQQNNRNNRNNRNNTPQQNTQPTFQFPGGQQNTQPTFQFRGAQQTPQQPQMTPEEMAMQREQVQQDMRQYQMEVIRSGMPPLPVQLTQEMDDQLVAEGFLPPIP